MQRAFLASHSLTVELLPDDICIEVPKLGMFGLRYLARNGFFGGTFSASFSTRRLLGIHFGDNL